MASLRQTQVYSVTYQWKGSERLVHRRIPAPTLDEALARLRKVHGRKYINVISILTTEDKVDIYEPV